MTSNVLMMMLIGFAACLACVALALGLVELFMALVENLL